MPLTCGPHEIPVMMSAGLHHPKPGLGLEDLFPRWCSHKLLAGGLSFLALGILSGWLECLHGAAAGFLQSKQFKKGNKVKAMMNFMT